MMPDSVVRIHQLDVAPIILNQKHLQCSGSIAYVISYMANFSHSFTEIRALIQVFQ
jgi:hypothetical protein